MYFNSYEKGQVFRLDLVDYFKTIKNGGSWDPIVKNNPNTFKQLFTIADPSWEFQIFIHPTGKYAYFGVINNHYFMRSDYDEIKKEFITPYNFVGGYKQSGYRDDVGTVKILSSTNAYNVLAPVHYKKLWEQEPCEECIFSLHTTNSYYTDMNYERKKGDYFTINSTLTQLYTANDIRYEATVYPQEMPGESIGETLPVLYLGKYNKQNWNYKPIQYINKLRVSGICFILAEAYCQDQKGHDALALEVINNYLAQREAPLLDTSLSGAPLLKAILQEKWKEFAGEGERYFDLKRYRKSLLSDWNLSATMKNKPIKPDDYRWLFPIPKGEYLYNENISQNAGWTKVEK